MIGIQACVKHAADLSASLDFTNMGQLEIQIHHATFKLAAHDAERVHILAARDKLLAAFQTVLAGGVPRKPGPSARGTPTPVSLDVDSHVVWVAVRDKLTTDGSARQAGVLSFPCPLAIQFARMFNVILLFCLACAVMSEVYIVQDAATAAIWHPPPPLA